MVQLFSAHFLIRVCPHDMLFPLKMRSSAVTAECKTNYSLEIAWDNDAQSQRIIKLIDVTYSLKNSQLCRKHGKGEVLTRPNIFTH